MFKKLWYDERALPRDYYSIREIGILEDIPEAKIKEMALETKDALLSYCRKHDIPQKDMPRTFNRIRFDPDEEINRFRWHQRLEPFARWLCMYTKEEVSRYKNMNLYYCFGVRKKLYDKWKKTGKRPSEAANHCNTRKYDADTAQNRAPVRFEGGGRVDLPKNAVYKQFTAGIAFCNSTSKTRRYTVPEVTLWAMSEFMAKRPELFGELKIQVDEDRLLHSERSYIRAELGKELADELERFLLRYNSLNTPGVNKSEFVANAVRAHLDRQPLIYTDPEAVAYEEETKRIAREAGIID